MPTITGFISRQELTVALKNLPDYIKPIILAYRDHKISVAGVMYGNKKEPVNLPHDGPCILIVCDDFDSPLGPDGFHQDSLRQFIGRCGQAVVVACEPLPAAYVAAARAAAFGRLNVILVETTTEQEVTWTDFIEANNPCISMLVATVKPDGGMS